MYGCSFTVHVSAIFPAHACVRSSQTGFALNSTWGKMRVRAGATDCICLESTTDICSIKQISLVKRNNLIVTVYTIRIAAVVLRTVVLYLNWSAIGSLQYPRLQ